ncbi:acyl-CoA dehydrogenase family protein [Streptomyces sp. NPDC051976]|uniref:acyl-CoA dehydrogenase family protein n=1 Tax=Streptomyces sp. NPDC051976 TaxID=3154947 RepID=UPI00343CB98B
MDFRVTGDQHALVTALRDLLAARFDRDALRAAVDGPGGLDRTLWRALGDAGFFALRLPEEKGGVGLGMPEAVLLFEEAGRALLPGPLAATHLAAGLVDGAATGEAVVTVLDLAGQGPHTIAHLSAADAVLVLGPDTRDTPDMRDMRAHGDGIEAVVMEGEAVEQAAEPLRSVDPLTALHLVQSMGISEISTARYAPVSAVRLRQEAGLLEAAQRMGSAARTLEMAVQHAREREQFGRPIGAFQAVKHLCAEMLVRAELARTAVYAAAVSADPYEGAAARLLADEAATRNARDCLQVFGGMGFTWEADVHLHIKRSWVSTLGGGAAGADEEVLAEGLLR